MNEATTTLQYEADKEKSLFQLRISVTAPCNGRTVPQRREEEEFGGAFLSGALEEKKKSGSEKKLPLVPQNSKKGHQKVRDHRNFWAPTRQLERILHRPRESHPTLLFSPFLFFVFNISSPNLSPLLQLFLIHPSCPISLFLSFTHIQNGGRSVRRCRWYRSG